MSIRLKLTLLLLTLFAFAIGNTLFTFVLESYGEEKLEWVIHTHKVLNESKNLLSTVTDTETGQRGYLLTGDPGYLEPYLKGISSSRESLSKLHNLTSDNPNQLQRLKNIKILITKKLDELKLTVDLQKDGSTENIRKAIDIVKKNSGKQIMDELRLEIISFESEERLLLERRKGKYRESRAQVATVVGVEIILFIFMGIFTLLFMRNKLFSPLAMLLKNTMNMENGVKQNIEDILPKDEMGYLLSRFYQMSEKVYSNTEALSYEATHDALTGLNNRAGLDKIISESIACTAGSNRKLAVFFVDLNKFKQLNDTLGHDAGDAVLKETANRLKKSLRSDDVVFRLGGDEFVMVINNITELSHVKTVVTSVLSKFTYPFTFNGNSIEISLSIGIAIAPDDSTNSEEILKFSDIAMYVTKHDKDHNYSFFDKTMLKRESDE